jgi:putative lipoic acid-binding regulatory protein
MGKDEKKSLIEFPCDFDIKVMGEANKDFSESVIKIIKKHDENFNVSKIEMNGSRNGKYISLTCNVYVTSQKQLDKMYIDLSTSPMTNFVL